MDTTSSVCTSGQRPPTTSSGDRTHPSDVFREGQMPSYSSPSSEASDTMTGEFNFSAGDPYPERQPSDSVPLSSTPRPATEGLTRQVLASCSPSSEGSSENAGFQRNVLMRLRVIEEQVAGIYGFMQAQASATLVTGEADPMPNPVQSIEDLEQLCQSLEEPQFYRMMVCISSCA
ncbi:uncharacterized protein [Littorina saxatilis]|uniref:uncharacterized protein n=1 Tax=Littorina saxatilis TaxID=31220 RepID=UPI0038B66C87